MNYEHPPELKELYHLWKEYERAEEDVRNRLYELASGDKELHRRMDLARALRSHYDAKKALFTKELP